MEPNTIVELERVFPESQVRAKAKELLEALGTNFNLTTAEELLATFRNDILEEAAAKCQELESDYGTSEYFIEAINGLKTDSEGSFLDEDGYWKR